MLPCTIIIRGEVVTLNNNFRKYGEEMIRRKSKKVKDMFGFESV